MRLLSPANKETRILLKLAIPAMVTQLSMTLVTIVDTIFIGRLGPMALGAAAVTGLIIFNITAVGDGFSTGMVATIARMIGEKDEENASIFSTTGIVILIILGLLLTPILLLGAPYIFRFMRLPLDLIDTAWEYYSVFIAFIPSIFAFIAISASFRARGDTRTPMLAGFGMNILNILLDWLLIFGKFGFPVMGLRGAALASGLSFSAGSLVLIILSIFLPTGLLTLKKSYINMSHFIRIVKIGVPSMIERFAMSFSQLLVMAVSVNPMGNIAIASFHIVMRLASLSFMPGFGFAIATASLTGQHLGASDPDGAERIMWIGTFYCGLVMAIISIIYFIFPEYLTSLFTSSTDIIVLTRMPLRIYALMVVFLAPAMVLRGGLQGAGDTAFTMKMMILSRFVIRLPLAWLLGLHFNYGLSGVWFAMCVDFLIRGFLFVFYTRRGSWRTVKV
ncbi:MAG: MATE family efflux transporter [Spirochaetales bacterium]|nr:MATE family efflux transporter [Spirochaetales bacterium]